MATETTPAPAAAAEKPAAAKKAAASTPLFALNTINGGDEYGGASPGTVFRAADDKQRAELVALEAARELTDSEAALAEKVDVRTLTTASARGAADPIG